MRDTTYTSISDRQQCSGCSFIGHLPKRERAKARRGEPAFCQSCKQKRSLGTFLCSKCDKMTYDFTKGQRKRARMGDGSYSIVCRPCQEAKEEKKRAELKAQQRREYEARQRKEVEEFKRRLKNPNPPWHPHEDCGAEVLKPDATITISSGGVCFGYANDIEHGLSESLRSVQEAFCDRNGFEGPTCSNIRARNGDWNAYQIHEKSPGLSTSYCCGWLFCHSDFDPVQEFRYFLYHSIDTWRGGAECDVDRPGCPLQGLDELGILKIGRYAWGQWQLESGITNRKIKALYKDGFQLTEYAKEIDSTPNSIFTKWPGGGKDYGRIRVDQDEAQALLAFGETTIFHDTFFAGMYPEGGTPKFPLAHPLGGHLLEEGDWPHWEKPKNQRKITDFFAPVK